MEGLGSHTGKGLGSQTQGGSRESDTGGLGSHFLDQLTGKNCI